MIARAAAHAEVSAVARVAIFALVFAFGASAIAPPLRAQSANDPKSQQQSAASPPVTNTSATNPPAPAPQQAVPSQGAADSTQEMNTRDSATPFSLRVNLVPIRVVVRDAKGNTVPNLRQDDFQIFEDHKLQLIAHFSVETPALPSAAATPAATSSRAAAETEKSAPPLVRPVRFVALLFDDVHLPFGDLSRIREVAGKYVDSSMVPTERFAIFTISGQSQVDFTDDRAAIHEALRNLQPRPVTAGNSTGVGECPSIDYYQADLIVNQHDAQASAVAASDALACEFNNDQRFLSAAQGLGQSTAMRILTAGDAQTQYSFRRLRELVKRMSAVSGQRLIVLLSPGFLTPRYEYEISEVIDSAARSSVVISTLDARGLYVVDASPDISERASGDPSVQGFHTSYRVQGQARQSDVLFSLADGTGGQRFSGSNDLAAGFRLVVSAPETSYVIGFVPQDMKYDGHFHSVKVALVGKEKYTIQARSGFYAPKKGETPADAVKQEIEEAVLSQEEQHGLPVQLHTQYYKVDATDAKLAVLTHVDIGRMRFDKVEGRNKNDLTVVAAIFDRNGNFVKASEKVLEMRLRDSTLERLSRTGVTIKTSFDVKPGAYLVRLVVRDSQGAQLSAENGTVDIPF
jgi:VWFA-related protein